VSLKYITKAKIEAKQGEIVRAELAATKMGLENERYPDEIDEDIEEGQLDFKYYTLNTIS